MLCNMLTGWDIYLITRLGLIRDILTVVIILAGTLFMFLFIGYFIMKEGATKRDARILKNILKKVLGVFLISSILFVSIPSTKELAVIKVLPVIVNNEYVQKLPRLTLECVSILLNKKIEQLKDKPLTLLDILGAFNENEESEENE